MKDRITLGHEADVAETAALTLADNCATERIFAAARLGAGREEPQGADQQRHPPIGEERPSICPKRPQGEAMGRNGHLQAGVLLQIEKSLRFD